MDLKNLSSNWKKLQGSGTLNTTEGPNTIFKPEERQVPKTLSRNGNLKRKRGESARFAEHSNSRHSVKRVRTMSDSHVDAKQFVEQKDLGNNPTADSKGKIFGDRINEGLAQNVDIVKYLALDCEMVGVGPHPHLKSALARVSVVNYDGEQAYDSYVKPKEEVTDWRTHVSGIQPKHMLHARSLEEVQADVAALIKGRIVVGHSLRGDFDALFLDHPKRDIRDTAKHPPYRKLAGGGSPKLKILVSELLGLDIQAGEHSSIEDARATILLFRRDKDVFEREHIKKWGPSVVSKKVDQEAPNGDKIKKPKKKKKKKK